MGLCAIVANKNTIGLTEKFLDAEFCDYVNVIEDGEYDAMHFGNGDRWWLIPQNSVLMLDDNKEVRVVGKVRNVDEDSEVTLEFIFQIASNRFATINSYLESFGIEMVCGCNGDLIVQNFTTMTPYTLNGKKSAYQHAKYGDYIVCKSHDVTIIPEEEFLNAI